MSAQGTVKLHVYGSSNAEYRDTLVQFRAFETGGALEGFPVHDAGLYGTGKLPAQWAGQLKSDESVSYLVYSYKTPIAWYSEIQCGWVIR